MVRIGQDVEYPPASLVKSFRDLPTAVLADVTDGETVMTNEMKPISTTTETVGTARTVRVPPGDNLTVHKALTLATPGDVLVVDARGYTEAAIWGELLSASAMANDLAGTVVDGAVRDAADIGESGYPVYARAVCPKPPEKVAGGSINVPVTCGGITVRPGDIVVGGPEGVATVDPRRAKQVREAATEKLEREAELQSRVETGEYLYDILDLDERFDHFDCEEITISRPVETESDRNTGQ